jgi:hypothetical protein
MMRTALLLSASLGWLSGCGEAERPRFVPASADAPVVSPADRQASDKAARETTIPKNIPMH